MSLEMMLDLPLFSRSSGFGACPPPSGRPPAGEAWPWLCDDRFSGPAADASWGRPLAGPDLWDLLETQLQLFHGPAGLALGGSAPGLGAVDHRISVVPGALPASEALAAPQESSTWIEMNAHRGEGGTAAPGFRPLSLGEAFVELFGRGAAEGVRRCA
jgi:hypothetical protein